MKDKKDCDAEEVASKLGFESVLQLNTICDVIITAALVLKNEKEQNPEKD